MFCPKCGTQLPDDAIFCGNCGNKLAHTAQPNTAQASAQPVANNAQPADGNAQTTFGAPIASTTAKQPNNKKKYGIAAAVVAAVIAAVLVVVFAFSKPISEAELQSALESNSSLTTAGVLTSQYVNDSSYTISDVKINDTKQEAIGSGGTAIDHLYVDFTAKVANSNFESNLSGQATFIKSADNWVFVDYSKTSAETKPLKGVDYLENQSSSDDYTTSDFNATLDESDGSYTSTASQKVAYDFWFATDTATNTRTFTFDNDKGWVAKGNTEASNTATEWKLSGKSFTHNAEDPSSKLGWFSSSHLEDWTTTTINFGDAADGNIAATYTLAFSAPATSSDSTTVNAIDTTGNLTGKPVHEFGSEGFSIELNDAENSVTFVVKPSGSSLVAGSGTVNKLSADLETNYDYLSSSSSSGTYKLSVDGFSLTQNV